MHKVYDPKALKHWNALSLEQQQTLLARSGLGSVLQFDTMAQGEATVVSIFFGMDCCIHSRWVYLLPDEAHIYKKEEPCQTYYGRQ